MSKRLNILIIPCTEWLKGSQQRLHHLSREWSKKHNISVFYLERLDSVNYEPKNCERLQYSSIIRIPTLRSKNYSLFLVLNFIFQFVFFLRIIKQYKIDTVIAEGLGPSNAGLIASKITNRRFIFDYSDAYSSFVASYVSNSFLKKVLEWSAVLMTSFNVHLSDATVIVNDLLLENGGSPKRKKIVNGVSQDYFPLCPSRDAKSNGTFVLCFMGAVESWVDFDNILDTIGLLNEEKKLTFILKIVGDGSKLNAVKQLVTEKGLDDFVTFTGWVPYAELHTHIDDSDVCILPFNSGSISMLSMPMKIHEYAISKRPIITSPLPEVKKIYGSSVLYAMTKEEYVQAIRLLISNDKLRSKLIQDAYEIAQSYSWGRLAEEYSQLFKDSKETCLSSK